MTPNIINLALEPPPMAALLPSMNRLLLAQTSPVTGSTDSSGFAPEMLTVRATQITVVLGEILEWKGYSHGGINE
jgi:hypothetical protein